MDDRRRFSLDVVRIITDALPQGCKAAIAVVMHSGRQPSALPDILNWYGKPAARFAKYGESFRPGTIFIAPPDHHLILQPQAVFGLDKGALVHNTRPALFASAAGLYGSRVVGVILSGANQDGAAGMHVIKNHGGLTPAGSGRGEVPGDACRRFERGRSEGNAPRGACAPSRWILLLLSRIPRREKLIGRCRLHLICETLAV
jgi:hypothetical protein